MPDDDVEAFLLREPVDASGAGPPLPGRNAEADLPLQYARSFGCAAF